MMRRVGLGILITLVAAGGLRSTRRQEPFPHPSHSGLFPTCLGCHRGIPTGEEERYYSIAPADCARCHDGRREEAVEWTGPTRTPDNLRFSHSRHAEEVAARGDAELECAECHRIPGESARMAVDRAPPEACLGCHAHEAPEHLAVGAACTQCHRTLPSAPELPVGRVAAFPEPPSHAAERFLSEHGGPDLDVETCAVCHARETCAVCHLNADRLGEIQALANDPRVAELVDGRAGEWPEPESHRAAGWEFAHGRAAAADPEACSTCHAEASCRTCHGAAEVAPIAALPTPGADGPRGVTVPRTRPPGHPPGFVTAHGTAAATGLPECSSCHVETECADCHERAAARSGPAPGARGTRGAASDVSEPPSDARPGYHPANFIARHGAEAFAVQTECSDCHSTEAFCRDCHRSVGTTVGVGGGAGGAFHDAQPNWFFEHGRAARFGLEACASCHQQTSCLRCHSAKAGLRVNPHGPGFDADRLAARSTISCGICHTSDQIPPP